MYCFASQPKFTLPGLGKGNGNASNATFSHPTDPNTSSLTSRPSGEQSPPPRQRALSSCPTALLCFHLLSLRHRSTTRGLRAGAAAGPHQASTADHSPAPPALAQGRSPPVSLAALLRLTEPLRRPLTAGPLPPSAAGRPSTSETDRTAAAGPAERRTPDCLPAEGQERPAAPRRAGPPPPRLPAARPGRAGPAQRPRGPRS